MKHLFILVLVCLMTAGLFPCDGISGDKNNGNDTALSNATLNGTYFINSINIGPNPFDLQQIQVTFDGDGNGTWQNNNTLATKTLTYSVESDGTVSFDIEEDGEIRSFDIGQVSFDGSYITIVDADA